VVVLNISNDVLPVQAGRLLAHPVPAREALNVMLPPELVARSYEIRSVDGRMVLARKVQAATEVLRVPLNAMPPGIYLLTVRNAEGRGAVVRFVKE
jgi:hypothetical protein